MVYDLFTFNGEYDLLDIRFNILNEYVDKFIICEGVETFSGNWKPLYWAERNRDRFEEWENKVIYYVVSEYNDKDILSQLEQRTYVDQPPFQRAFYQKESLRKALQSLNPDKEDIVYYGDVDEIWKPKDIDNETYKLRQLAYSYFLNNRSSEDWRGTIVTRWKNLREGCLNDMRANPVHILEDGGWHFTNMNGYDSIIKKLESYDHQEVNIPWVKDGLKARIDANIDFLGRNADCFGNPINFWVDESELPEYILNNKDKYAHLWK